MQNVPKFTDHLKLDKDLLVFQCALTNEILPWNPEEGDWQLAMIIEQYHHAKVAAYLPTQKYYVDSPSAQNKTGSNFTFLTAGSCP